MNDKLPDFIEIKDTLEKERILDCDTCTKCKNGKEQFLCFIGTRRRYKFRLTMAVFGLAVSLLACALMAFFANLPTATFWVKTFDAFLFLMNFYLVVVNLRRAISSYEGMTIADKMMMLLAAKAVVKYEAAKTATPPQGVSQ